MSDTKGQISPKLYTVQRELIKSVTYFSLTLNESGKKPVISLHVPQFKDGRKTWSLLRLGYLQSGVMFLVHKLKIRLDDSICLSDPGEHCSMLYWFLAAI